MGQPMEQISMLQNWLYYIVGFLAVFLRHIEACCSKINHTTQTQPWLKSSRIWPDVIMLRYRSTTTRERGVEKLLAFHDVRER